MRHELILERDSDAHCLEALRCLLEQQRKFPCLLPSVLVADSASHSRSRNALVDIRSYPRSRIRASASLREIFLSQYASRQSMRWSMRAVLHRFMARHHKRSSTTWNSRRFFEMWAHRVQVKYFMAADFPRRRVLPSLLRSCRE